MFTDLDWAHHESFHLGALCELLELDCTITDNGFNIQGYDIVSEMELAAFVSALKIVSDKNVFMGDLDGEE